MQPREPVHILNIALKSDVEVEDSVLSEKFSQYCAKRLDKLQEKAIRRITFVVLSRFVGLRHKTPIQNSVDIL